jgi:hypothetical protein
MHDQRDKTTTDRHDDDELLEPAPADTHEVPGDTYAVPAQRSASDTSDEDAAAGEGGLRSRDADERDDEEASVRHGDAETEAQSDLPAPSGAEGYSESADDERLASDDERLPDAADYNRPEGDDETQGRFVDFSRADDDADRQFDETGAAASSTATESGAGFDERADGSLDDTGHAVVVDDPPADGPAIDDAVVDQTRTDDSTTYRSENAEPPVAAESTADTEDRVDTEAPADVTAVGTAAVPDEAAEEGDLKPGAVQAEPITAFWDQGAAEGIRDRWRDLQLKFIDDPSGVAGEAERLVEEAVNSLTASVSAARERLGSWRDEHGDDTERLRAAVRGYRDFLDKLLGL